MSLLSALLFPAPDPSYSVDSFPGELLWIPGGLDYAACKAGDCAPAVLLRCPNARYLVLYLHSNGEDIGLCYPFGRGLRRALEVHVLLVEYPGYGLCPGQCSEEAMWRAARAAFRFAAEALRWPPEDVILMGRSLGAAVASRLACAVACNGLILVAPFLSLADAVAQYIGGGLARLLLGGMFSTEEHVGQVRVPTLVVHGREDRLVAWSQGQRLFDLCPHKRKLLVCPEGMGHNCDLLRDPAFLLRPMLQFFSLPDYNFDELAVPVEAFNKALCPQYHKLVALDVSPLGPSHGDQEPFAFEGLTCGTDDRFDDFGDEDFPRAIPQVRRFHPAGSRGFRAPSTSGSQFHNVADSSSSMPAPPSTTAPSECTDGDDVLSLPELRILDIENGISRFLHESEPWESL